MDLACQTQAGPLLVTLVNFPSSCTLSLLHYKDPKSCVPNIRAPQQLPAGSGSTCPSQTREEGRSPAHLRGVLFRLHLPNFLGKVKKRGF